MPPQGQSLPAQSGRSIGMEPAYMTPNQPIPPPIPSSSPPLPQGQQDAHEPAKTLLVAREASQAGFPKSLDEALRLYERAIASSSCG
ncbi:MAG: hypothetical protein AAGF75_04715, partial [Cyanobacteria bacterium P01_H01_bin.130]